jgi:hypothetical protein
LEIGARLRTKEAETAKVEATAEAASKACYLVVSR